MRELQLMRALDNAGTGHYDFSIATKKDGTRLHIYFLSKLDNEIKEKLKKEFKSIKGLRYSWGTSNSEYAPELRTPVLIRESFK